MPTLRAVNRTRSSVDMPMPGLYRSSSVEYRRCERRYAMAWAAMSTRAVGAAAVEEAVVVKVSRRRMCSGERGAARMGRGGSSRRMER